jgi:predicted metal-dependent peptidase
MSREDMSFGVSQLIGLDDRSEGIIVPCDCQIYWDQATKIKTCKEAELTKVKVVGRGGTMFAPFFTDYEKNLGKADFLILMTDGYLMDTDIAEMKDPGIPVYWIIVSGSTFVAPFGRVFSLRE